MKTLKENAIESEKKDLLSELNVMKSLEPHVRRINVMNEQIFNRLSLGQRCETHRMLHGKRPNFCDNRIRFAWKTANPVEVDIFAFTFVLNLKVIMFLQRLKSREKLQ